MKNLDVTDDIEVINLKSITIHKNYDMSHEYDKNIKKSAFEKMDNRIIYNPNNKKYI